MKKLTAALVLAAAAVESSCEDRGPHSLPTYPGLGLVVTVVKDASGEPIRDAVVTAQAENGGAPWTVGADGARCVHVGSGAGTYSVRAERARFRPGGLLVRVPNSGGACSVAVETPVTIRLASLP